MAAVPSIGRATQVQPRPAAPEADATRALYERYHRQIFSFCLHQLGNREEAEDAVQGTFLNAFRGLKSGIVPEHESAWVFKIASNVCMTRRRASFRRGRVESASDLQAFQDVIPGPRAPGDELMGLSEALAAMPDQQRTAILLREWQGLSYREIAEDMKLTQGAVETLIFRARRTLASGLEEQQSTSKLSRLRHAGDFGSLLAAAKTFLAGSAAVKVAATVAIATTTVVATETKPANPTDRKGAFVQKIQNEALPAAPAAVTPLAAVGAPSAAFAEQVEAKRVVAKVFAALVASPAPVLLTDPEPAALALLESPERAATESPAAATAPALPPPVAAPSEQPATHAGTAEPKSETPRAAAAEQPKAIVAAERPRAEQPRSDTKSESKSEPRAETRAESKGESRAESKAEAAKGESKAERARAEHPRAAEPSSEQAKAEQPKNEARTESKSETKHDARGEQPKSETPAAVPATPSQPNAEEGKAAVAGSDSKSDKAFEKTADKPAADKGSERAVEKNEKSEPAPKEQHSQIAAAPAPVVERAAEAPAKAEEAAAAAAATATDKKDTKKGK